MPPDIKNFRQLVAWLVEEHHHGVWYEMAKRLQVSSGLVYQWRDGTVKRPSDSNLDALIKAYELDYWKVWAIITGRKPPTAAAWLLPLVFALACSLWPGAKADAQPLPIGLFFHNAVAMPLITIWRRYWRRAFAQYAQLYTVEHRYPTMVVIA